MRPRTPHWLLTLALTASALEAQVQGPPADPEPVTFSEPAASEEEPEDLPSLVPS